MRPRILVVDDEGILLNMFRLALRALGCDMVGASSLAEGLELGVSDRYDLVLLDNHFPEGHGDSIVPQLLAAQPEVPIVVITGNDTDEHVAMAIEHGAREVLKKPFGLTGLSQVVKRYCEGVWSDATLVA